MAKKQNRNEEFEITKMLYENKWEYNEEIYLATYELMKEDELKEEKVKKLLEQKVLLQIQSIFGRVSPCGNLDKQSFADWMMYLFFDEM